MVLSYQKPYLQIFDHPVFNAADIQVSVLREDLNHPFVTGNKWWKLRDNLSAAKISELPVVTFGGAYSNHIYATAAACKELGLRCYGIIRGDDAQADSPTLVFARNCGMILIRVSREQYRNKTQDEFLKILKREIGDFYLVPEGGSNSLAVAACADWGRKIFNQYGHLFDAVALPVGTGGTMAGLISGINGKKYIHGFSVLKNGAFLIEQIKGFLKNQSAEQNGSWKLHTDYHFGGYGKANEDVFSIIKNHKSILPLDAVYTAKMLLGIIDLAEKGKLERGCRLLVIHTGGLQGNVGFGLG